MIQNKLRNINNFKLYTKTIRNETLDNFFITHQIQIETDNYCTYKRKKILKYRIINENFVCFYCDIFKEYDENMTIDNPILIMDKVYILKYDNPVNVITNYYMQRLIKNVPKKYIAYCCSSKIISFNLYLPEILFISKDIQKYLGKIEDIYLILKDNKTFLLCDVYISLDYNLYIDNFRNVIIEGINIDCFFEVVDEKLKYNPLKVGYNLCFYYMLIGFIKKYKLFNNIMWYKYFDDNDIKLIKERSDKSIFEILENITLKY